MAATHGVVAGGLQAALKVRPDTGTTVMSEQSVAPVRVSLNVTVEVGVATAENGRAKVAVKVKGWFTEEVACTADADAAVDEITANVRFAGLTVWGTVPALVPKFASPPYDAVTT